jgi:Fic family protein
MNTPVVTLNAQLTEWQSLQPLKREDHDRLWRKLRLDWNYHSNHIEGNTLTYGETAILLIHGQATGDHGLRDYMEMQAHDVAIDHMKALVAAEPPLTEGDIRDFNRILIKESFWKDAITPDGQPSRIEILPGEYKKQPNNVRTASGEIFRFADPADVPIRMGELVAWLRDALEKTELHPIEIASKLHHDFVLIHPFGDGNGRTARILVNYVLMRSGYLPLVVPTQQKDRYLAALRRADAGDLQSLTDYLAGCLETSMERGIAAAKGESIEEEDDLIKEIEVFKRRQRNAPQDVIPKSDQALTILCQNVLAPLLEDYIITMGKLTPLFTQSRLVTWILKPGADIPIDLVEWIKRGSLHETEAVRFSLSLLGFKGTYEKPFNVESEVLVELGDFHYSIKSAGRSSSLKRYSERLDEQEIKTLIRPALESAFHKIKKETGEE